MNPGSPVRRTLPLLSAPASGCAAPPKSVINEDVATLTSGARTQAERLGYAYAEIAKRHRFRYLFEPLRVLQKQDQISAYWRGEDPFPQSVEIDPSNACNHHCTFCIYASKHSKEHSERMPASRLLDLVRELAVLGVTSVLFVGGGEPMTHPATVDAIELAAEHGLSVGLVTNGSRVKPELGRRLKQAATYIRFSLDAADPQLHQALHGQDDHHRIIANLRALTAAAGPATVGTGYFINDANVHDLLACGRLVKDAGADYIQYKSYSGIAIEPVLHTQMLTALHEALALDDETFDVHIVDRIFSNDTHQVRGYTRCHWQQFKPVIGADGDVFLCAQKRTRTQDGEGISGVIGNVLEHSFAEVWRGERRQRVLRTLQLEQCPFCVHHPQNQLLEFLGAFQAPHRAFI